MVSALVVDDVAAMRLLVSKALERQGDIKVVGQAADAASAVAMFRELRPDIVTLDLILPDEPGLVVLRRLRQVDPNVRVVVISANATSSSTQAAMAAGAKGYVCKPVNVAQLVDAVRAALEAPNEYSGSEDLPELDEPQNAHAPAILVVEDDAVLQALLAAAAIKSGCRVLARVESLGDASAILRKEKPALMLLDLSLRDGEALPWLAAMRAHRVAPPTVVVSAHAGRERVEQAIRLGVTSYLLKPVGMPEVVSAIRKTLNLPAQ